MSNFEDAPSDLDGYLKLARAIAEPEESDTQRLYRLVTVKYKRHWDRIRVTEEGPF